MKLLLRETVDQLGTIGDIVNVPDGYGRNYLLPRGIALAVTPENIRRLDAKKQVLLAAEAEKRVAAEKLAELVKAKQVTIHAKAAGEEGKLYGSVTAQAIADQLAKDGLPIEARMILLDQPIKELGVFDVRVRLFPQVEVEAKLWVVDESTGTIPSLARAAEEEKEKAQRKDRAERAAREKPPGEETAAEAPAGEESPKEKKKRKKGDEESDAASPKPAEEAAEASPESYGKEKKGKKK